MDEIKRILLIISRKYEKYNDLNFDLFSIKNVYPSSPCFSDI